MPSDLKLVVEKREDPVLYLQKWVRSHWSRDLFVSGTESLSQYERRAQLGVSRFTVNWDDKHRRYVGQQRAIHNVGSFRIRSTPRCWEVSGPGWLRFEELMQKQGGVLVTHSERLMVKTAHRNLVNIDAVQMALTPLRNILVGVHRHGHVELSQIRKTRKSELQIQNYLRLLSTLQFAKIERDRIVPGPRFKSGLAEGPAPELYDRILASVVQESFQFLRFVLHFSQVVGYLRWANSYYLTSWESGRGVTIPADQLNSRYSTFYGSFHRSDLEREGQIQRVADAGLLVWDKRGITGAEEITEAYLKGAQREFASIAS